MKLEEYRQHYIAEKVKAEGNLLLIEAEATRVRAIVLRFEGAIACIEAQAKEESILQPTPGEDLSEEDIQRALRDNQIDPLELVSEESALPELAPSGEDKEN